MSEQVCGDRWIDFDKAKPAMKAFMQVSQFMQSLSVSCCHYDQQAVLITYAIGHSCTSSADWSNYVHQLVLRSTGGIRFEAEILAGGRWAGDGTS